MIFDLNYFHNTMSALKGKIIPLQVYICCIGKRRFMIPETNLSIDNPLYLMPCEIKPIKFPLNIKVKSKKLSEEYILKTEYLPKGKKLK